jgi:glycosyltransferase involved in cell wall biosynthesis
MSLSVTVITRDEEAHLEACLESVAWADEIVVVDAQSGDRTVEIANKYTSRVFVRPWPGFAAQKNFALDQATSPWVLSLDADERVLPELREEIRQVLAADGPLDGYYVPRQNVFLGRVIRHGGLFPDHQLRLFRRGAGRFRDVRVHEGVEVTGRVGHLRGALLHSSYRSVADFVERADRYSTLAAQDLVARGTRVSWIDFVARPAARFCSMYLLRAGFLDGAHGLLLALLYAYYVLLRTAKAWELAGRGRETSPTDHTTM